MLPLQAEPMGAGRVLATRNGGEVMAESKVQKVARGPVKQARKLAPCAKEACGGEVIWAKVIGSGKSKMACVCQKCGNVTYRF